MRRRLVHISVGIAIAAVAGGVIVADTRVPAKPAATANDIAFDHTIHAGRYGIPCLDCHVYADKSPVAGLPSGRKCMGCHKFVAKDSPSIQKLAKRVAAGEPLVWTRVFAIPDFIYFSHRMHVRANVACTECHGNVATETTVAQDRPFTMGRCLACHQARHATRDCLGCHK